MEPEYNAKMGRTQETRYERKEKKRREIFTSLTHSTAKYTDNRADITALLYHKSNG